MVRSPTLTKSGLGAEGERLEAAEPEPWRDRRGAARGGTPCTASAMARMCAGVVPQQPPAMLRSPRCGELAEHARPCLRALVVAAELVGQAGIGMGATRTPARCARAPATYGRSCFGAERAVEPDRERPRVRAPSSRTPRWSGRTACGRDASVMVPEIMTGRRTPSRSKKSSMAKMRRLGVERVEDRLDQEQVGAALDQRLGALGVGSDQLVEGDGAEARVVHIGRDRRGAVGGPEHAGDEARPAGLRAPRTRPPPRARAARPRSSARAPATPCRSRPCAIGGRVEGVRLEDVGAGLEVARVDAADDVRAG